MKNLMNIIEAIIFSSGKSIAIGDILERMPDISRKELDEAVSELQIKYSINSGVLLLKINDTLQMVSNSKYGEIVTDVLLKTKEKEMSRALLETLAIIAYKRMVTKQELEEYRGTSCDYTVMKLSQLNLIEVVGRRDAPGKPYLYSTTNDFLKKFGLNTLDELPNNAEIQDRIKIINENYNSKTESLFNEREIDTSKIEYQSLDGLTAEENESYKRVLSELNSKIKINRKIKNYNLQDFDEIATKEAAASYDDSTYEEE